MWILGLLLLYAALAFGADERVQLTIRPEVVQVGQHLEQTIRCDVVNITTDRIVAIQIYDIPKERVIAFVGVLKGKGGDELKPPSVVDPELQDRMTATGSVANVTGAFLEIQHRQIWSCCNVHQFGCMVFFGDGTDFVSVNATAAYKPQNANSSRIMAFKHCPPPPAVAHGNATDSFPGNYPSGSHVTYTCKKDYVINGNSLAKCRDGEWQGVPTCIVRPKVKAAAWSPLRISSPATTPTPCLLLAVLTPLLPAVLFAGPA